MELHNKKIDIAVIDKHPLFREGLKRVLEVDEDLRIVAEGSTSTHLLALYEKHLPDIVLIEANLPSENGVTIMKELHNHFPWAKVVFFTVVDDFSYVSQAIKAGASGYLLKEMDASTIISAIKIIVEGGFYLHPKLTKDFLTELGKLSGKRDHQNFLQTEVILPYHLLSVRESQVLQLLADGHSNRTLGKTLEISEKTVKNHVSSILRKMDLTDRTQAVVTALKNGWVELR